MTIPAVKGTRDLYPDDYAPIRRIFDAWRSVSLRHGFEEFDGPTLELLDLYREKSGEELVGQLYRLTDSGGRELALRPEMTPTLARMVAARVNALPKPIKWFCIPTLFRGENVQRGRLREFFQWNVDIIGAQEETADAECILVGVEALRELGLTANDFAVSISSRQLMGAILTSLGIASEAHAGAYAILDKVGKMKSAELAERWDKSYGDHIRFEALNQLLSVPDLAALRSALPTAARDSAAPAAALENMAKVFEALRCFGISDFCRLNLHVVRGLAYYTGVVFEFYDRSESERAICGGGRYDSLLAKLGKSSEPAVGFGMGDVVLSLILKDKGLLKPPARRDSVYVAAATEGLREELLTTVAALRRGGIAAEFSYAEQPLAKQLKIADKRGCCFIVILDDETQQRGIVQIKKRQEGLAWKKLPEVPLEKLKADPKVILQVAH